MVLIKVLLVTSDLSFMVSKKVKMNRIFTVPTLELTQESLLSLTLLSCLSMLGTVLRGLEDRV